MLATRTLIGMIVGGLIIGLGGYSLVDTFGASTVSMNENFVIGSGDNASFSIPAPKDAPQYMKIIGDDFDLKLTSPGEGLTIPNTSYKKELVRSRVETTSKLIAFIKRLNVPPKVLISASAIGYYGASNRSNVDELSEPEHSFTHEQILSN